MDKELRLQILRAAYGDRLFLKTSAQHINPEWFTDPSENAIARAEVEFWTTYEQPIGVMLRTNVGEIAEKNRFGKNEKQKLTDLVNVITRANGHNPPPVKALQDKLKQLKRDSFYEQAIDEIITAHEQEKLTVEVLAELVEKAKRELDHDQIKAIDYLHKEALLNRIARRRKLESAKYPKLFIAPLDRRIKMIGRGHVGLFVAPFASGKGLALLHVARSYALQGLNVLHFTLEDPIEEIGDRLDSAIAGVPKNELVKFPKRLLNRFKAARKVLHGRIHLIDATEGGWTVTRFEQVWEEQRQQGFIADAVLIDYDDEIECEETFKGESAKRMQSAVIYRRLRRMASRLNVIVWTAAQGTRASEGHMQVTGRDTAEDISKVRKVTLAIGIGAVPDYDNRKHLFVGRHRLDRSRFGVTIATNFAESIFYDAEETMKLTFESRKERNGK